MFDNRTRGSILVLSLIISGGIFIVGIEVSLFVIQNIRHARNIDNSLAALYTSESGVESALYQIRKEDGGLETLRRTSANVPGGGRWTYLKAGTNDIDEPTKFSDEVGALVKSSLFKNESVEVSLYTSRQNGAVVITDGISNVKSLKVEWDETLLCGPSSSQKPLVEATLVEWTGNAQINWDAQQGVRKVFKEGAQGAGSVVLPLCNASTCATYQAPPMVVRIKTFFCNMRSVKITLHRNENGTDGQGQSALAIPNYITLRPVGTFRGIGQALNVTFPARSASSGLFDYVLFSEKQVCKNDSPSDPQCQ